MSNKNVFILLILALVLATSVYSVNIELFYGTNCPYCKKEIKFLDSIKDNYSMNITFREIYNNKTNKLIYDQKILEYKPVRAGIPATIIGNEMIMGFSDNISLQIVDAIKRQSEIERIEKLKNCELNTAEEGLFEDSKISMLLIICSVILMAIIITTLSGSKKRNKKTKKKLNN